ncbi:hypothetical protein COHA_002318 [Chlorella ohadii]|uniref:Large ribosomal subunit protein uL3m n=1 Tax=Chlorella ohadii TaxID=2649997 RepID=A0AAD5DXG8_9CHLO|nr:hypothetical protein COHA_002318 [Chlorella ohadii]
MLRAGGSLARLAGLLDAAAASTSGRGLLEGAAAAAAVRSSSIWQQAAAGQRSYAQLALAEAGGGGGAAAAAAALQQSILSGSTRRTGLVAVKVGMTQEWDAWGVRVPLTVLWVDDCQVVQVKTDEREGYTALQLGAGAKRPKQLRGSLRGHFEAAGVPLKRKVAEFRVTPDALLPVGHELRASHFVAGQFVDVSGTSIGKGFQGVMKRWGFSGQPASHGNSLAHRAAGSTGACQDPGKVFKGKKMPGRMGGERVTVQNCQVFRVDPVRNLLYVRGQVPGHKGNWVLVKDSVKKSTAQQPPLPVPTMLEATAEVTVAPKAEGDPYAYRE